MERGPYKTSRTLTVLRSLVHFKKSGRKTVTGEEIIGRMFEEGYDGTAANARNVIRYHADKLGIKRIPGDGRGSPVSYKLN